jgi:hypothetical protein
MHVAAGIGIGLVALLLLLVAASLSPFVAIPVAVFLAVIPALWVVAARRLVRERHSLSSEVPSSREASYDPAVDPAERPE